MSSYFDDHAMEDESPTTRKKEDNGAAVRDFMSAGRTRAADLETDTYSSDDNTGRLLNMFRGLHGQSGTELERLQATLVERMLADEVPGSSNKNPPASQRFIDSLEAMDTPKEDAEESCGICLNQLPSVVKQLPCKHLFHPSCIVNWLHTSNTCPACRRQFPAEEKKKATDEGPMRLPPGMPAALRAVLAPALAVEEEDYDDSMYG
jgi:hypothetical protein